MMTGAMSWRRTTWAAAAVAGVVVAVAAVGQPARPAASPAGAEFCFLRVEYADLFRGGRGFGRGFGRGWWMQDWPRAEEHFTRGVRRLTRLDLGEPRSLPLTDDRIFDYPWIYATQVGYWNLSREETDRLAEYFRRGGFLVVDDFWGPAEWEVFREAMERALPGRPILEVSPSDPMMNVLYNVGECVQIPGLRHLRRGPGGGIVIQPGLDPPHWRAIYDARGRMLVAINYNMDIGDAWEEADVPEYPAEATGLAYRFAINSIIYAMTH